MEKDESKKLNVDDAEDTWIARHKGFIRQLMGLSSREVVCVGRIMDLNE